MEAPAATASRARKDTANVRQMLELIAGSLAFSQGWLISTMPRGSVRLLQPARLPEPLLKAYERTGHAYDRAAWTAIIKGQPVRATDCWHASEHTTSIYYRDILKPNGFLYSLAIPLTAPLLDGYPGVMLLMRSEADGNFTDAELARAKALRQSIDQYLVSNRPARAMELALMTDPWTHSIPVRHLIFGKDGRLLHPKKTTGLPARVQQQLAEHVRQGLEASRRGNPYDSRVSLPDERGELWIFEIEAYKPFPAISDASVVFVCLQPEAHEWGVIKAWELAADEELSRMLPAMKYMLSDFAAGPTLADIARKSHLSAFHFHRRFTDLVGQTPKHFLVACQMHAAKRMLVARRRTLPQIASDCGFSHQSHFTSRFRQTTGLTPTRWRRIASEIVMRHDSSR